MRGMFDKIVVETPQIANEINSLIELMLTSSSEYVSIFFDKL
jgi:hypothetical protein